MAIDSPREARQSPLARLTAHAGAVLVGAVLILAVVVGSTDLGRGPLRIFVGSGVLAFALRAAVPSSSAPCAASCASARGSSTSASRA